MKRKIIALIISIISIVSLSVFIGTVSADGKTANNPITGIDYEDIAGGYGMGLAVKGFADTKAYWTDAGVENYVEVKLANGTAVQRTNTGVAYFEKCGSQMAILRGQGYVPAAGDTVKFLAGFEYSDCYLDADVLYSYNGTSYILGEYTPPTEVGVTAVNMDTSWNAVGIQLKNSKNTANLVSLGDLSQYITIVDDNGDAYSIRNYNAMGENIYCWVQKEGVDVNCNLATGSVITIRGEIPFANNEKVIADTQFIYNGSIWTETFIPSSNDATLSIAKNTAEADDISYMPTAWGYPTVQIKFNSTGNWGMYASPASGFNYVELVHADGSKAVTQDALNVGTTYFIFRFAEAELAKIKVGDKLVLKQGMYLQKKESLKETLTYVFTNVSTNSAMVLYNSAVHDLSSLSISNEDTANEVVVGGELQLTLSYNEGALFTPTYASDNTNVATVDATGKVTGVAAGTANITVTCGTLTDTYAVSVVNPLEVTDIEGDVFYDLIAEKDSTVTIPANFTVKKVYDNGTKSAAIALTSDNSHFKAAVDTSVIPAVTGKTKATVVVSLDDEDYELELYVTIYEVAKLQFTEAAVVDWFGYATFVEFPNVSVNKANFTGDTEVSVGELPDYADHIEYYRDGAKISCGAMLLGGGNIALFPTKNNPDATITLENFGTDYYKAGDVILLKAGLTTYGHTGITDAANGVWTNAKGQLYKESVLESDVMFKFNGVGWDLYIPYTDVAVESATIEVALGTNNISVGAKRVPDNATSGTFTYSSSNTQVVTVSETGKLTGVAEGTATITITLEGEESVGPKTTTVTVTVTNKIVKLEIAEVYKLGKGETEIDLTKIVAKYVKGDGTKVDATDIASAQIIGFDAEAGAQTVTVVITHEGQRYTANLDIEVAKSGCGSTIATTSIITLLASFAFVALKKKEN